MQVSDYNATFTLMHLVFLELDTHHCHLEFKFLDKATKVIIQRTSPATKLRLWVYTIVTPVKFIQI